MTFGVRISAGEDCVREVMEFMTRINFVIRSGCFVMDPDDGTMAFRTFLSCDDAPSGELIRRELGVGHYMWSTYGDALLAVVFGMKDPKTAYKEVLVRTE